ncbi:melanoma antigen recognized by T-cells 1 [Amia ocellicauda]|uniref:melanoma antigen recognized by T-cells 1 n=1 Tax=Amia ocellicauda TaxID=2972642 RepID=UPI003464B252|nr:MAR1 protein [Amia calva]
MPRGDFNVHFSSRGNGGGYYVRAEEAAGIALLVIILAVLLIIGCWYYRRRSGYKIIRSQGSASSPWRSFMKSRQYSDEGAPAENKMALNEFSNLSPVVANAPPAYEKISAGSLPPPYSP